MVLLCGVAHFNMLSWFFKALTGKGPGLVVGFGQPLHHEMTKLVLPSRSVCVNINTPTPALHHVFMC
jgi:hypothetical protein